MAAWCRKAREPLIRRRPFQLNNISGRIADVERQALAATSAVYAFFDDFDMVTREVPAQLCFVVRAQRQAGMIEIAAARDRRFGPACLRHRDIREIDQRRSKPYCTTRCSALTHVRLSVVTTENPVASSDAQ